MPNIDGAIFGKLIGVLKSFDSSALRLSVYWRYISIMQNQWELKRNKGANESLFNMKYFPTYLTYLEVQTLLSM